MTTRARARGGQAGGAKICEKKEKEIPGDHKRCTDCKKVKPLSEFNLGSLICTHPCLRAKENCYRACRRENCLDWLNEQYNNAARWRNLKRWYLLRCSGAAGTLRAKAFSPLQYQQVVENEIAQLRDGHTEMMHSAAFAHFCPKPKNVPPKGLTQPEADRLFEQRVHLPDTIVDYEGEFKGYETRIGVKTKTVLLDRVKHTRKQGYCMSDKRKWLFSF